MLVKADEQKHASPLLFRELLEKIFAEKDKLNTEQLHYLYLLQGYSYAYSGSYDNAEEQLSLILEASDSKILKFRASNLLIYVYSAQKKWGEGLFHVAQNIELWPEIQSNKHVQESLMITIIFYNQIQQYDLALSYTEKLARLELSPKDLCLLKQQEIDIKFHQNTMTSASEFLVDGLEICRTGNYKIAENIIHLRKSELLLNEGYANKAISVLSKQITDIRNTHYPMLISGVNNVLAEAYFELGELDNALTHATEALEINKNVTNLMQGVETYYLLYQIAKQQKKFTLALQYHERFSELDRQHLEGEKAKHLAYQLAEHQNTEQESKIALLNEKNALLTAQQALSEAEVANTRLIIAFLVVSLILIALWGGRLYKAHKRIRELAEYDALTGIFNRGHFTHVANSALKYCQNAEQDLSVIIFDLDNFKTVNDSYGHATGDWALKEATKVCKNLGRQNDIFARLGGEEFCILLPSCNIRSAALRAEECRHAIEDIITEASGHDFRITASFGVTDAKTSGFNLEKLLADADEAAYTSKHSGRNRVTVYEVETAPKQAQLDGSWSIS
ncbi:tetratricopeptide repeat-containing diguanylate cyclase [Litorilituus sediminis]|nr:GGDEF domain-containing protein [Litorilituus sediminis]